MTADLEVIHYGLMVGCGKKDGGSMVICETNSQAIIQVISSAEARRHHIRALIEDSRTLIKKNWGCRMVHTYCKANFFAYHLAYIVPDTDSDFTIITHPPLAMLSTCLKMGTTAL